MEGHVIMHGNVPATALAVARGQRTPRPVPVTWNLPLAFRKAGRDEPVPVADLRRGGGSPIRMLGLDGALWTTFPDLPDPESLGDAVAGRPHRARALIDFPFEPVVPDWSGFRSVVDDGRGEAERRARDLSGILAIWGDRVLARREAPLLSLWVHGGNGTWITRSVVPAGETRRSMAPSIRFGLADGKRADEAGDLLRELTASDAGTTVRGDWTVEVHVPELLARADMLADNIHACITCIGMSRAFADLTDATMDRWLAARRHVDRPLDPDAALPAASAMGAFAVALAAELPALPQRSVRDLSEAALLAAVTCAVAVAVSDGACAADRAGALSLARSLAGGRDA